MKWLETIKVQVATGFEATIMKEFNISNQSILKNPDRLSPKKILFYNHALVPGHFIVFLKWDTEYVQTTGSLIGLNLLQSLKAFGLIDHSVWIQKEFFSKGGPSWKRLQEGCF
jgi:hypothetical protein